MEALGIGTRSSRRQSIGDQLLVRERLDEAVVVAGPGGMGPSAPAMTWESTGLPLIGPSGSTGGMPGSAISQLLSQHSIIVNATGFYFLDFSSPPRSVLTG